RRRPGGACQPIRPPGPAGGAGRAPVESVLLLHQGRQLGVLALALVFLVRPAGLGLGRAVTAPGEGEGELVAVEVDLDRAALYEPAEEKLVGERLLHVLLDGAGE